MTDQVDTVLAQLVNDVEMAVHALYRGEVRQTTARARTEHLIRDAAAALRAGALAVRSLSADRAVSPRTPASVPIIPGAAVGWSNAEGEAVMKCITGWLPVGLPSSTPPEAKCIAVGHQLVPTWRERELAWGAVRKLTGE